MFLCFLSHHVHGFLLQTIHNTYIYMQNSSKTNKLLCNIKIKHNICKRELYQYMFIVCEAFESKKKTAQ